MLTLGGVGRAREPGGPPPRGGERKGEEVADRAGDHPGQEGEDEPPQELGAGPADPEEPERPRRLGRVEDPGEEEAGHDRAARPPRGSAVGVPEVHPQRRDHQKRRGRPRDGQEEPREAKRYARRRPPPPSGPCLPTRPSTSPSGWRRSPPARSRPRPGSSNSGDSTP